MFVQHLSIEHVSTTGPRKEHYSLTFICTQNLSCFRILLDILNDVDQVGHFGEERIIVGEPDHLLIIIAWLTNIKHRLDIWVHQSSMVAL